MAVTTTASVREPREIVNVPAIGKLSITTSSLRFINSSRHSKPYGLDSSRRGRLSPNFCLARRRGNLTVQTRAFTDEAGSRDPDLTAGPDGSLLATGDWIAASAVLALAATERGLESAGEGETIRIDVSGVGAFDTAGALLLSNFKGRLEKAGREVAFVGERDEHRILLREVTNHYAPPPPPQHRSRFVDMLADVGRTMIESGRDLVAGVAFLGQVIAALGRLALHPGRFRVTALVNQIEQIAFKGAPIIMLMSFLVGAIISQQGIFQLQRFGATSFVVDLVGILVLRELGVLLTAIMVAGRSGSAFTAEIGSMKMREEIDAIRVMGLDPVEVLIVPRILALVISLPLLTFLASMAAIFGALVVSWIYGGITPDVFLSRLKDGIALNTFFVGLIKAPFMAIVIGVIACVEGMAVKGSAESLGRQVTTSVVKSIFVVIVMDGLFAVFFAAIDY
ncbi:MAG: MlaE family lipid ABC transporter permease subunit [Salinarimonadaceae bacterium]|nr:MAG: MlaE family lipid ABC transporter permease subunit [Salinarimonadaceae bacterium]